MTEEEADNVAKTILSVVNRDQLEEKKVATSCTVQYKYSNSDKSSLIIKTIVKEKPKPVKFVKPPPPRAGQE